MRCPKCGYISFDHLEVCLKCKKNISTASDALQGGVLNVVSPVFLNLQSQEDQSDEYDLVAEVEGVEDVDMGGEFDIIVEEESQEEGGEETVVGVNQSEGEESDFVDFDISPDEDMGSEIAVDSGLFDDDSEIEDQILENQLDNLSEKDADDLEIEIPEELMDMSDLSAPTPSEEIKPFESDSLNDLDSLSIELDGLDLDLDSDIPASGNSAKSVDIEEDILSLGDIDFSDTISGPGEDKSKKSRAMDMDDDLNFDLDLGGLSIHDDI